MTLTTNALVPSHGKYDTLVLEAALSCADLERAVRMARAELSEIEDVLMREFRLRPQVIGTALSRHFGVPYEPYRPERIKPALLLKHLKAQYVEDKQWLPLDEDKNGLLILATDPERVKASRIVNQVFPKSQIRYCVTTSLEFKHTVDQYFGTTYRSDGSSLRELLSGMDSQEGSEVEAKVSEAVETELVRLVNKVIMDAYRQGVSDIHIEPLPGDGRTAIRFRKDGAMMPYIDIAAAYRDALVSRVKIMCDLDTSERRKPQDGKIKFNKYGPLDIELRVATLPSTGGVEDIVMRILAASDAIPLERLELSPLNFTRLQRAIEKPYGLFFVCGPTGSGKTTSLHSLLAHLNKPDTKIWTAEDPVEITQKGLRQVQVNKKAGLDFATVMRAFLRADPDVIMVGEMRDRETVAIGIEASLTGHLVLATLHTNSAPESIVRLLDMGMDPFNFADALLGILAQRLARRLCTRCRMAYHPGDDEMQQILDEYCAELGNTLAFTQDRHAGRHAILARWAARYASSDGRFTLYRAQGCGECNKGYNGRLGLHELMIGSERIKELLQERARVTTLLAAALDEGMLTLKMDGIEKVLQGLTDLRTVRQVCMK
ncbi:GspE/PulE family protein [Massilia sp. CF038]|uniref:GspE/PulE family protein n=1 Tax=Massilia sp. CF038 TaxID=1881045 RepID=UPI0009222106|nr:GspE/PulE family protein [Massilia sp. CF038]SHG51129.1 Type II secretory pathway ATPase GspE/PulE or T4P pilus assembly pathway ATPase PilB [Massilia sp. CF038]